MCYFVQVCKIDVKKKESVEWKEENCYPSEPVFVANPGGTDEDDGTSKDEILAHFHGTFRCQSNH